VTEADGFGYTGSEDTMPRIADYHRDCVLYLYKNKNDARKGEATGGCGFFVTVGSEQYGEEGWGYRYAVTCQHLLAEGCFTIRVNTEDGGTDIIETSPANWEYSRENDIAACTIDLDKRRHACSDIFHRIAPGLLERYPRIPLFITEKIINDEGIGMGDEVFLVGRLIDHSGKQRNTPSARFGHISMMPFEPIMNPHLKKKVEAFLCEVKSIGGFSGSPVFVYIPMFSKRPNSNTLGEAKGPWLLGIDWGHTLKDEPVLTPDNDKTPGGFHVLRDSGIACVAPAWHVANLLACDRFRQERERDDADLKQKILECPTALDGTDA